MGPVSRVWKGRDKEERGTDDARRKEREHDSHTIHGILFFLFFFWTVDLFSRDHVWIFSIRQFFQACGYLPWKIFKFIYIYIYIYIYATCSILHILIFNCNTQLSMRPNIYRVATGRLNDIKKKITFTSTCVLNFLLFYFNLFFFSNPPVFQWPPYILCCVKNSEISLVMKHACHCYMVTFKNIGEILIILMNKEMLIEIICTKWSFNPSSSRKNIFREYVTLLNNTKCEIILHKELASCLLYFVNTPNSLYAYSKCIYT